MTANKRKAELLITGWKAIRPHQREDYLWITSDFLLLPMLRIYLQEMNSFLLNIKLNFPQTEQKMTTGWGWGLRRVAADG